MPTTHYQQISEPRILSGHPYDVAIGERLKAARIQSKLTQAQLGKKLFLQQGHVSEYETGKYGLKLNALPLWAEALGCEVKDLIV
ncbi:MAG: helix-turn-helix domain-containing protein [Leptolyngbyaceae cyanobacterium]